MKLIMQDIILKEQKLLREEANLQNLQFIIRMNANKNVFLIYTFLSSSQLTGKLLGQIVFLHFKENSSWKTYVCLLNIYNQHALT